MRHVQQRWYITPHGFALEDLPFLGPDRIPTKREQFCLKSGKMRDTDNQKTAKDLICRALGIGAADSPLGKKFCAVFPMGTGMDDIEDFREFIYHYILPQPEIDPEALQREQIELENLNDVLLQAKNRAQLLTEICELGETAYAKQRDCVINQGFVLCAKQQAAAGYEEEILTAITKANMEIDRLQRELGSQQERTEQAHQRFMKAAQENQDSSERQQLQVFEDLVNERKRDYREAQSAQSALENAKQEIEHLNRKFADCKLALTPEQMPDEIEKLPERRQLEQLEAMERLLHEREKALDQAEFNSRSQLEQAEKRRDALRKQIETLEKGQLIYPDNDRANWVCQAINREFVQQGMDADARVLCELLTVQELDWQNCVEACLGDRRFDILVAPKHYRTAKRVFEQLGAEVGRVSLLDSRALERDADRNATPELDSLAAKVTSESWLAKHYVNSLLGQIICCDTSETLENFPHSATRDLLRHFPYRLARLRTPKLFIGLDALQPQGIIASVGAVVLPLFGVQLVSQALLQCFVYLVLVICLVLYDLFRAAALGGILVFFLNFRLQQRILLAKLLPRDLRFLGHLNRLVLFLLLFRYQSFLCVEGDCNFFLLFLLALPFLPAKPFRSHFCLKDRVPLPLLIFLLRPLQFLPASFAPLAATPVFPQVRQCCAVQNLAALLQCIMQKLRLAVQRCKPLTELSEFFFCRF